MSASRRLALGMPDEGLGGNAVPSQLSGLNPARAIAVPIVLVATFVTPGSAFIITDVARYELRSLFGFELAFLVLRHPAPNRRDADSKKVGNLVLGVPAVPPGFDSPDTYVERGWLRHAFCRSSRRANVEGGDKSTERSL